MYGVEGKPGRDCFCNWCQLRYSQHRPYGGFVPFIDPIYQSGVKTLYGIECCKHCYQRLLNLDVSKRQGLAIGHDRNVPAQPTFTALGSDVREGLQAGEYPARGVSPNRIKQAFRPTHQVRGLASVQGAVHLCLTRWADTQGAPHYSRERWRTPKFKAAEFDPTLPGFPNKRGRRKPSLRSPRQISLV